MNSENYWGEDDDLFDDDEDDTGICRECFEPCLRGERFCCDECEEDYDHVILGVWDEDDDDSEDNEDDGDWFDDEGDED